MLPKINRFSFKKGTPKNTFSSPSFVMKFEKNQEEGLKCAVVVSKKVDRRAVIRNKVRREFIRIVEELLGKGTNYSLVFILRKQILDQEYSLNLNEVKNALEKTKII